MGGLISMAREYENGRDEEKWSGKAHDIVAKKVTLKRLPAGYYLISFYYSSPSTTEWDQFDRLRIESTGIYASSFGRVPLYVRPFWPISTCYLDSQLRDILAMHLHKYLFGVRIVYIS
jgi:hypothetical protein